MRHVEEGAASRRPGIARRQFLLGAAGTAGLVGWGGSGVSTETGRLPPSLKPDGGRTVSLNLVAAERQVALPCFGGNRLPLWTYTETNWLPIVRLQLGDRLEVDFENRLPRPGEHSSIHWHGIRLPNDQDGVPYLVQRPVEPGETFHYSFEPPDTGTYFFHPHCNTAEQLGRGLVGLLIVEGDEVEPYAADQAVLLRDWRLDDDTREFASFRTIRGADRAGTYGSLRTANGERQLDLKLPALGDCRLRIVNVDPTRIMNLSVEGAAAAVIAVDGVAVAPFELTSWQLAPAMRLDLAVRAPKEGGEAYLVDDQQSGKVSLVRMVGKGPAAPEKPFNPAPLRAGRIPEPSLAEAERLDFVFGRAADGTAVASVVSLPGGLPIGTLCGSINDFWSINGKTWPGRDHQTIPAPLARLVQGRSYVFSLRNSSQLSHPAHIHGHTFKVLKSNLRPIPVHHADTVLLLPEETVEVAFVADNPGRWMFHCHVIEHQEAGMMGFVEVS